MNQIQPSRRRRPACAISGRVLLLALALVAGCGGERSARANAPSFGGTLVVAASADLDFANSLVSREAYTQDLIQNILFLPLLRYDPALGYEPRLARSWEVIGDTVVVFRLRDDVRWHDGVPTTAHDVAFTFERARDPATAFAHSRDFQFWRTAEVVDSFTIRFEIEPHPDPLASWPQLAIMPRHLLDTIPPERLRLAAFNRRPVGNGPFRFVSATANDRWIFAANDSFPEELGGRPYLDRFVWRVIPESAARRTELLTGGVDLALGVAGRDLIALRQTPGVRAVIRPSRKYQALIWNGKRKPFDDPRVRRALTHAIDRQELLDALRGGYGELGIGPVFPGHWAFDSTLAPLPFDTAAARALLAEAGFEDRNGDGRLDDPAGKPFEFELSVPAGNEYSRNVAEVVQAQLARIGVGVKIQLLEFGVLTGRITAPERRFDAVFLGWESGFQLGHLNGLFHSAALSGPFQFASYRNPVVDSILDEVDGLERAEALPLWRRFQEIFVEEQPWTILYYVPDLAAVSETVQGVEPDIRGYFVGVPRWWKRGGLRTPEAVDAGGTPDPAPGESTR